MVTTQVSFGCPARAIVEQKRIRNVPPTLGTVSKPRLRLRMHLNSTPLLTLCVEAGLFDDEAFRRRKAAKLIRGRAVVRLLPIQR